MYNERDRLIRNIKLVVLLATVSILSYKLYNVKVISVGRSHTIKRIKRESSPLRNATLNIIQENGAPVRKKTPDLGLPGITKLFGIGPLGAKEVKKEKSKKKKAKTSDEDEEEAPQSPVRPAKVATVFGNGPLKSLLGFSSSGPTKKPKEKKKVSSSEKPKTISPASDPVKLPSRLNQKKSVTPSKSKTKEALPLKDTDPPAIADEYVPPRIQQVETPPLKKEDGLVTSGQPVPDENKRPAVVSDKIEKIKQVPVGDTGNVPILKNSEGPIEKEGDIKKKRGEGKLPVIPGKPSNTVKQLVPALLPQEGNKNADGENEAAKKLSLENLPAPQSQYLPGPLQRFDSLKDSVPNNPGSISNLTGNAINLLSTKIPIVLTTTTTTTKPVTEQSQVTELDDLDALLQRNQPKAHTTSTAMPPTSVVVTTGITLTTLLPNITTTASPTTLTATTTTQVPSITQTISMETTTSTSGHTTVSTSINSTSETSTSTSLKPVKGKLKKAWSHMQESMEESLDSTSFLGDSAERMQNQSSNNNLTDKPNKVAPVEQDLTSLDTSVEGHDTLDGMEQPWEQQTVVSTNAKKPARYPSATKKTTTSIPVTFTTTTKILVPIPENASIGNGPLREVSTQESPILIPEISKSSQSNTSADDATEFPDVIEITTEVLEGTRSPTILEPLNSSVGDSPFIYSTAEPETGFETGTTETSESFDGISSQPPVKTFSTESEQIPEVTELYQTESAQFVATEATTSFFLPETSPLSEKTTFRLQGNKSSEEEEPEKVARWHSLGSHLSRPEQTPQFDHRVRRDSNGDINESLE